MKKANRNRVFTAVLITRRNPCSDAKEVFVGFKTGKVVEKLQKEQDGYWMPPGGRRKKTDKSLKHCAKREVLEEVRFIIPMRHLRKMAVLDVRKEDGSRFALVHVYGTSNYFGTYWPHSREMTNMNFCCVRAYLSDEFAKLPHDEDWLLPVFRGQCVRVMIVVGKGGRSDVKSITVTPTQFNQHTVPF